MSSYPYSIINYAPDDYERFVEFCREAELDRKKGSELITSILEKKIKRPHYSPYHDLFIAKRNASVVGFLNIIQELRIGRIILDGFIHPQHRRQGLATEMFCSALKRAAELKAKVAHVCLSEGNFAARFLIKKLNFNPVRCFLELQKSLSEDFKIELSSRLVKIGHFHSGEETKLASIQNKCFKGSWGFCPNTTEEIKFYLDLTESGLKDVIAARSKKDESIIGYCWTQVMHEKDNTLSKKTGRIHMFGVDPDYHRKGLGRKLLLSGLDYLKKNGVEEVELTVDKENIEAYTLYRSLGFKIMSENFWYERKLLTSDI